MSRFVPEPAFRRLAGPSSYAAPAQKVAKLADFREGTAGGAEGNRTPDLCSAIARDSGINGRKPCFGAPQDGGTSAEQAANWRGFHRSLSGPTTKEK